MAVSHRKRVLVIDDDENDVKALKGLFESRGYDRVIAWGGQEALRFLRPGGFDIVLLGHFLSQSTSEEILDQIRGLPVQPLVASIKAGALSEETTPRHIPLRADCSFSMGSPAAVVGLIEECLSHHGPLAVRGGGELMATQA